MSDNFGDVMFSVDLPDLRIKTYVVDPENCFTLENTRTQASRSICGESLSKESLAD